MARRSGEPYLGPVCEWTGGIAGGGLCDVHEAGTGAQFAVFRNGLTSYRELLDREVPDWAILPRALFSVDMMQPFYDSSTNDVHSWIVDPLSKASVPPKVHVVTLEELLSSEW